MKFGMTDEQYQLLNKLVIEPLKKNNAKVFIFGSRVGTKYHSHSDIDILFQKPDASTLPAGLLSEIREAIEESRFPFTVDLVDKEELASSYRSSVLATMVEV